MVDFLVLVECLIDRFFDRADGPKDRPTTIVIFVCVAMVVFNVTETIIFQCVANDLDIAIVQIEVIAAVLWQVGPDRDWVLIWTKHQKVPLDFPAQLWCTRFHCLA